MASITVEDLRGSVTVAVFPKPFELWQISEWITRVLPPPPPLGA